MWRIRPEMTMMPSITNYVDDFWSLEIVVKTTGKIAHFTHFDLFASNFWTHMIGFTNVLLLWLEKFSCTCMCTMGDAQLQARKTRAFFQPELSFKCCLFFFISSNRHGSRFHKLYEQEKKIRKIHNFLVKIKSLNLYQLRIILYSIITQKWKSIKSFQFTSLLAMFQLQSRKSTVWVRWWGAWKLTPPDKG